MLIPLKNNKDDKELSVVTIPTLISDTTVDTKASGDRRLPEGVKAYYVCTAATSVWLVLKVEPSIHCPQSDSLQQAGAMVLKGAVHALLGMDSQFPYMFLAGFLDPPTQGCRINFHGLNFWIFLFWLEVNLVILPQSIQTFLP